MAKKADIKLFVAAQTEAPSTFIRLVDGAKEYKLDVFDDQVLLHIYAEGQKVGSSIAIDIEKLPPNENKGRKEEAIYDDEDPNYIRSSQEEI